MKKLRYLGIIVLLGFVVIGLLLSFLTSSNKPTSPPGEHKSPSIGQTPGNPPTTPAQTPGNSPITPTQTTPSTQVPEANPPKAFYNGASGQVEKLAPPKGNPKDPTDPQDRNAQLNQQIQADLNAKPAYQKLPFHQGNVSADFTDVAPDGRIVVQVHYTGSVQQAIQTWRNFLIRYHDPGKAYVVYYQKDG